MPSKISDVFGISESTLKNEGVFNKFIDIDSKLYVDPHLLKSVSIEDFQGSYSRFQKHFEKVLHLLKAVKHPEDVFVHSARKKLTFRETPYIYLGYSADGRPGRGIGESLASKLTETALQIVNAGIDDPVVFELVGLIEEGIGADLISDMTIYIILPDLLRYSERVARSLNLQNREVKLGDQPFYIPAIPSNQKPVILLPCEILNDLPIAHGWDDISRVCAHNSALRSRVNQIIGSEFKDNSGRKQRITKRELKYILLNHPEVLKDLIEQYKVNHAQAYDFEKDPSGLIVWEKIAQEYAQGNPLNLDDKEVTANNVFDVVMKICRQFKRLVETNGLCVHLWNESGKTRNERFAQLLFFGIADSYCEAENLDLSREPNAGRGPVDFKFSSGYDSRVNVEIKYTSNPKLRSGYEKQLPVYNAAEQTQYSIFLVIRTTDHINSLKAVRKTRDKALAAGKKAPHIIEVDGRIRPSASNVR